MNSSTSKNKRSKQENSTWTKTRLNETKTKLKRQGKSVLKITFKILHNIPPPLEKASSSMQKDVIHINGK